MSIRHTLLGFLDWKPLTGYELKKLLADSLSFHWSGNSNQVYGSLLELHRSGLASLEVQRQESRPPRKVYAITEAGRRELRSWLLAEPELPELRGPAQQRLAWARGLSDEELDGLLAAYEELLAGQVAMRRERIRRAKAGEEEGTEAEPGSPGRDAR